MSHRSRVFHGPTAELPEKERTHRKNRRRRSEETYLVTLTIKNGRRPVVIGNVSAENCEVLRRAYKNRSKLKKTDRVIKLTDQVLGKEIVVDVNKIALIDIQ